MDTKNIVVLTGHLSADPELRYTSGGKSVANFSLAVNRSFRGDDGKWHDKLDGFFDCEYFSNAAERFTDECKKGSLIQVTGTLGQDSFTVGTEPNTRKVSKIVVRVKTLSTVLVDRKKAPTVDDTAPAPTNSQPVPQPA